MNPTLNDILNVAGGNKELVFSISLDNESLIKLTAGIFFAMLLAVIFGGLMVKRIG